MSWPQTSTASPDPKQILKPISKLHHAPHKIQGISLTDWRMKVEPEPLFQQPAEPTPELVKEGSGCSY